jgi:hypothetical protein
MKNLMFALTIVLSVLASGCGAAGYTFMGAHGGYQGGTYYGGGAGGYGGYGGASVMPGYGPQIGTRPITYLLSSGTNYGLTITMLPGGGSGPQTISLPAYSSIPVTFPGGVQVLFTVTCSNGGTFTRTYTPGYSMGWAGVTDGDCNASQGAMRIQ